MITMSQSWTRRDLLRPAFLSQRLTAVLSTFLSLLGFSGWSAASCGAEDLGPLRDLLADHCYQCHGKADAQLDVDFETMTDAALLADSQLLETTVYMVQEREMPPSDADEMPEEDREKMVFAIHDLLAKLRNAAPDDPGVVVAPRINHSEFNYVVRDLTGLQLDLGQFLIPDNQAGEGFVNVGAAQNMTVGQFEAYFSTAKKLATHALITPDVGLQWQMEPLPPATNTPQGLRDYLAERWRQWHDDQWDRMFIEHRGELKKSVKMFVGAYFEAAWRYQHRAELDMPKATFADIAAGYDVPLYASGVRETFELLTEDAEDRGPLVEWLAERWQDLPDPEGDSPTAARQGCRKLEKFVHDYSGGGDDYRGVVDPYEISPPNKAARQKLRGQIHHGTWPYTIDLNKTEGKTLYLVVADGGDGNEGDFAIWENAIVHFGKQDRRPLSELELNITAEVGKLPGWQENRLRVKAPSVLKVEMPQDATRLTVDLRVDDANKKTASVQTVILDHPPESTGYIIGRGVPGARLGGFRKAKKLASSAEFLTRLEETDHKHPRVDRAFHGFPEEALPYYPIRLPQNKKPRGIFGPLPPEMHAQMDPAQLAELDELKRLVVSAAQPSLVELSEFFDQQGIALPEGELPQRKHVAPLKGDARQKAKELYDAARQTLTQHDQQAREILRPFITRAWRQPIDEETLTKLVGFYHEERGRGASFAGAVKVSMAAALIHPNFLYRFNQRNPDDAERPLRGNELATRLAFVLWGSLPDDELLSLGDRLQSAEVLQQQIDRMLQDERSVALSSEFAAHWLQFHDFKSLAQPDAERFGDFTEVKEDMQQEAILFFDDLFRHDRPVSNVIDCDYAFLNKRLADWYGIPGVNHKEFRRVTLDGQSQTQRGGVLGMGAVLVKYSEPLRTSPVRRGAWVHENLLGIHLPLPPANVGMISDDERNEEGMSIREQLEQHRETPSCFSCHDKIDPPGVALEKFDAVGRWRNQDLAGEPIDDQGKFVASGMVLDGVDGLRHYLLEEEQDQFLKNFCNKLLGYCLGREVEPTDQPLLEEMMQQLRDNDLRPSSALRTVLFSRQFRNRRNSNL